MGGQRAEQKVETFMAGIQIQIFQKYLFHDELEYIRSILSLYHVYGAYLL